MLLFCIFCFPEASRQKHIRFAGAAVTEEFYINDTGTQIANLKKSIEAVRKNEPVPEDGYHGEYIHELAAMDDSVAPEDRLLVEQKDKRRRSGLARYARAAR